MTTKCFSANAAFQSLRISWPTLFAMLCLVRAGVATDLIPFGSNWTYLHSTSGLDGDPTLIDDEFIDNWTQPNYDTTTPIQWAGPSPAPFAYGNSDALGNPNVTHIEAFMPESPFFVREAGTFLDQPPAGDRYTTYFRHTFTTDVDSSNIGIELLMDDGAKLYLDGTEFLSFNCCEASPPGQPAEYFELTAVGIEEFYSIGGVLAGEIISAGEHTIAVEVHQQDTASSDMGFSMRLFNGYIRDEYINAGEAWSFFKGTSEPSNGTLDWTSASFDDAAWESGVDGFGYEAGNDPIASVDSLVNTPLEDMNDDGTNENPYSTFYLRKSFNVDNPEFMELLFMEADYDDAFIAYINGVEVARTFDDPDEDPTTGLPFDIAGQDVLVNPDGTQFQHESTNGDGSPGEQFVVDLVDFPGLLNQGENNVLAIQAINWQPSSDFVMAQLELRGIGEQKLNVGGTPGDYDGDADVDLADIDALSAAIRNGSDNTLFDANNDGVVDGKDRATWVEEIKNTYFGDSNLDGEFNTRDFVLVFGNNEYEDNIAGNSDWGEGDWNGDGDFSSGDFVIAFQGAGFEIGPRENVAAATVPEPSSIMLVALFTCLGIFRIRRT